MSVNVLFETTPIFIEVVAVPFHDWAVDAALTLGRLRVCFTPDTMQLNSR